MRTRKQHKGIRKNVEETKLQGLELLAGSS